MTAFWQTSIIPDSSNHYEQYETDNIEREKHTKNEEEGGPGGVSTKVSKN